MTTTAALAGAAGCACADIPAFVTAEGSHFDQALGPLAGAVVGSEKWINDTYLAFARHTGPNLSPFNAWVLSKSLETLAVRMDRHCENARAVVDLLVGHPAVDRVLYPQLPDHPGHAAAAKQMRDFGGMVSFTLKGGVDAALDVGGLGRPGRRGAGAHRSKRPRTNPVPG